MEQHTDATLSLSSVPQYITSTNIADATCHSPYNALLNTYGSTPCIGKKKTISISSTKEKRAAKPAKLTLASVKNPAMSAIINGLYRFETEAQAWKQLRNMTRHNIRTKEQPDNAMRLWVRGAFVTKEEKEQGAKGNVIDILPEKLESGRYCLRALKVPVPVDQHPQRKKFKGKHPNWSHSVLRHVQKGTRFESAEEVMAQLEKLHMDYPDISIPAKGRVHIIMYQKSNDGGLPVRKVVVKAQAAEDGSFFLELKEKEQGKKAMKKLSKKQESRGNENIEKSMESQGYFSAMVALKRKEKQWTSAS